MCPSTRIRIVIALAVLHQWHITMADVKTAFLQTGARDRDVYVRHPREYSGKSFFWLLEKAEYGLFNANAKWQAQSDQMLKTLRPSQLLYVPQLFYFQQGNNVVVVVAKIVDDHLITGEESFVSSFLKTFDTKLKFGSVTHGPGCLRIFGLDICQHDDFSITIDADEKRKALEPYPLSRFRRKASEQSRRERRPMICIFVN